MAKYGERKARIHIALESAAADARHGIKAMEKASQESWGSMVRQIALSLSLCSGGRTFRCVVHKYSTTKLLPVRLCVGQCTVGCCARFKIVTKCGPKHPQLVELESWRSSHASCQRLSSRKPRQCILEVAVVRATRSTQWTAAATSRRFLHNRSLLYVLVPGIARQGHCI